MKARVVGGLLAVAVSSALLVFVLARPVGLNPLNSWTVLLGIIGGLVAVRRPVGTGRWLAALILILALFPALPGGLGLLYLPSLALLGVPNRRVAALPC